MEEIPPEPKDRTKVVIEFGHEYNELEYRVIWRNDFKAYYWPGAVSGERWFSTYDHNPMTWAAQMKHVDAVYGLFLLSGDGVPVESWTERRMAGPDGRHGPWHPTAYSDDQLSEWKRGYYDRGWWMEERTVSTSPPRRLPAR